MQCSPEGVPYWVEQRPLDGARCVLCRFVSNRVESLTPSEFSVRSKVHEYGGVSWCFIDEAIVFVNESDQQLYRQSISDLSFVKPLTNSENSRFIEPVWDRINDRLIAVEELHLDECVVNRLVSISLSTGVIKELHSGYDFYTYPSLNPVNGDIAFIGWNHPYQPWVSTQLVLLHEADGGVFDTVVAGEGVGLESLSQPLFLDDGRLLVVSDRSGWWNLYEFDGNSAELSPLVCGSYEMISAPWQSGLRHYVDHQGLSYVNIVHEGVLVFHRGVQCDISGIANVRSLAAVGDDLFFLASFCDRADAVIKVDLRGDFYLLAGGDTPLAKDDCSIPVPLSFGDDAAKSFAYLYPATNAQVGDRNGLSPLVIFLHGGPTAATYPVLNLKIQYWTQRGFSVLDLNYRGSTNYGRDYRLSLHRAWGEVEVQDISNAIGYLVENQLCDPRAVFVRGNSSGGYSALCALAQLDCFAAGASLYGVTDPLVLNQCTHKFESHYLEWLIGDPVQDKERYDRLAPVHNASEIDVPVIFFQGEKDRVVLPEQTRAMVSVLEGRGVHVESLYFEDEAHGFRKLENGIEVLRSELTFYQAVLK